MNKILYLSMISITMLIFSCQKNSDLGFGILPDDDIIKVNIIDTLSLKVYTKSVDTLITDGTSMVLLGEYIDPIFGYTKASFVTQFGLAAFPDFNIEHTADSIVLSIQYSADTPNYYGDTTIQQDIEIYRLNQDLDSETDYYGNHDPSSFLNGDLIAQKSIVHFPNDSNNILNITLSASLASEFLNAEASVYDSSDKFKSFFKGIFVKAESIGDNGSIIKYDINSNSVITLYYHHSANVDSVLNFKVTANFSSGVRFNMFEHKYNETDFAGLINSESISGDSVAYIQGMGGLNAKVTFPTIMNLKNIKNIVIYRAELYVKTIPDLLSFESQYPSVKSMYIKSISNDNSDIYFPEYSSASGYLAEQYLDGYYKFDIATYVQDVIDGRIENNGIYLIPYAGASNFHRSIITGNNHSDPMKLVITYGKF